MTDTTTYAEQRTDEEKTEDAEILARVKAGIMKLERMYGPEWVDKIDHLDALQMESGTHCVLGKVYGQYRTGRDTLKLSHQESVEHGFLAPSFERGRSIRTPEYDDLTRVWKQELRKLGVQ